MPGWISGLGHLQSSAAASVTGRSRTAGFCAPSVPQPLCRLGQRFLKGHVHLTSMRESCSFAFWYPYGFLEHFDCLSHGGVSVWEIKDPVFYNLCPTDAPQPRRFKALCANHLFSENGSPFSLHHRINLCRFFFFL